MTEEPDRPLDRELAVFETHRAELVKQASGKFALIRLDEVAGIFDDEAEAALAGWRRFGNVPVLVKRIAETDEVMYLVPRFATA